MTPERDHLGLAHSPLLHHPPPPISCTQPMGGPTVGQGQAENLAFSTQDPDLSFPPLTQLLVCPPSQALQAHRVPQVPEDPQVSQRLCPPTRLKTATTSAAS